MPLTTPLLAVHERAGARMTEFGGWTMPLHYGSQLAEHHAVRTAAGLFDLCHMGRLLLTGPRAGQVLDRALTGRMSTMPVGRAKYTMITDPGGGVLDDLVVYRLGEAEFLVVANAANREVVLAALTQTLATVLAAAPADGEAPAGASTPAPAPADAEPAPDDSPTLLEDATGRSALIALQGPAAQEILAPLTQDPTAVRELRYYRAVRGVVGGTPALLARTGYTGEDGFELFVDARAAQTVWDALREAGGEQVTVCGLACRDTLRLEAAMPLYGHELTTGLTPFDAGLGRVVDLTKEDFVGAEALREAAARPPVRRLVGLAGTGRRAPRAGYRVLDPADGQVVGEVTSGALSPTLGTPIALAYVDAAHAGTDTGLQVDVRGTPLPVTVVPTPFYRRGRS